jgi:hypothetical protein
MNLFNPQSTLFNPFGLYQARNIRVNRSIKTYRFDILGFVVHPKRKQLQCKADLLHKR